MGDALWMSGKGHHHLADKTAAITGVHDSIFTFIPGMSMCICPDSQSFGFQKNFLHFHTVQNYQLHLI